MGDTCINEPYQLGDPTTSNITIHLTNQHGRPHLFHSHSSVLTSKSKFFADQLPNSLSNNYIEVSSPDSEHDHYIKLLNLLYTCEDAILDSLDSVKSTLGLLRASISLGCESIIVSCVEYLEAMPWEEKEEEEILNIVPTLGTAAETLLPRFQPAKLDATKNVFISAIRVATSIDPSFPPFTDEVKISAQEQVEYMLAEDEETPLVAVDGQVKSEAKAGLAKMFATFKIELSSLSLDSEQKVLQSISDLDWICNVLMKMDLMTDFVSGLAHISDYVLAIIQDVKHCSDLWAVKVRLIELVGKALDAIGFGNVVLPPVLRIQFLKKWLPYLRTMKQILDSKSEENEAFPYKMDADLCQNIEGAIVSLVLALPSSDQAEILGEWMKSSEQLRFPDLTEAFEVWCYRTKAAKRRLVMGFGGVGGNPTVKPLNEISN